MLSKALSRAFIAQSIWTARRSGVRVILLGLFQNRQLNQANVRYFIGDATAHAPGASASVFARGTTSESSGSSAGWNQRQPRRSRRS